ncbi:MAG: T9SS type A sorting domain-containing protein, partial [Desulfobacterales bacterium]|nr:T9SS type A sorting domain-containing protein [Desulfobacterales bacterium]
IKIIQVEVGDPEPESICGSKDNRKASNDKAIGRLVPIGCTGWIIKNGKLVTAGHCVKSSMEILEFNVPKSSSNGAIRHPAPEHQYTVNQGSIVSGSATSQGTDWAVFTVYKNSKTRKSPIQAQGKSYNVVRVNSAKNIRITGFGVDDGSANQTQQTHVGPFSSSNNNKLYYSTDTRGGNSGSPVIDASTGNAIGVHTHGGCSSSGGANSGTNAKRQDFWNAMGLGSTPPPPPSSGAPIGKLISLKGNNGKYVCSESGKKAMICNRTSVAGWEKFTVVDAGSGKIALKGNNGKYVTSGSPMWCNSNSLSSSAKFSWVDAGGGKIALKGSNGKYVSSENGVKSMNCNRSAMAGWEKFTYQVLKATQSIIANTQSVALYPNPASGEFKVLTNGFNNATFTLLDMRGAAVLQRNDIANEMNISTTDIPAGVYIVKINDAENTVIERLIIK